MLSLITSIRYLLAILIACVLIQIESSAAVIYVNAAASGANNGNTWTDAYTDLQNALEEAASGDEIWVARGTYYPSVPFDFDASGGTDPRESVFRLPSGASLYGGFIGTEAVREARNWSANVTVLSGDIDHNDINTDGDNIANSVMDISGSNAYHVIFSQNAVDLTRVDGFTITAGQANFTPGALSHLNRNGGGWLDLPADPLYSTGPTIVNSTFIGNYAESGGGAYYAGSGHSGAFIETLIQNCAFTANQSNLNGGALHFGSYSSSNTIPVIRNCVFTQNEALRSGGAIFLLIDEALVENSTFRGNKTTSISPVSETSPGSGGAVRLINSNARFYDCYFHENHATGNPTGYPEGGGGGALHITTVQSSTELSGTCEPHFIDCGFYSNTTSGNGLGWGGAIVHLNDGSRLAPKYINCVFYGNEASSHGGAVFNYARVLNDIPYVATLEPTYTNCTFAKNISDGRGGAVHNIGYINLGAQIVHSELVNCILWDNVGLMGNNEIYNSGDNVISYSLIEGSGGSASWDATLGTDGGNNIDDDPDFMDIDNPLGDDLIPANLNDGLKLNSFSPAINSGNDLALGLTGISLDYSDQDRFQGSHVDIGAYENSGFIIPWPEIYWLWDWKPFEPNCLTCPWSLLLHDWHFSPFTWDGAAQLIIEGDKAVISGRIIEREGKAGFDVYLELINKKDWNAWSKAGRGYVAVTPEAYEIAKKMHHTWSYWELSKNSKLTGFGSVSGTLQLKHWPSDFRKGFQQGEGGNSLDKDLGISGSFTYSGKLKINGKSTKLFGIGSLNADSKLCSDNCEVLKSSDSNSHLPEEEPLTIIYPNPAHNFFIIKRNIEETYNVELYSVQGTLILKSDSVNDTEYRIEAESLEPGLYLVRIITATNEERHFITISD